MIDKWIKEIKENSESNSIGMILVHNGIVRASSRDGQPVKGMKLSYDQQKLNVIIDEIKKRKAFLR